MPDATAAQAAIAGLNGTSFGERTLTVNEAREREERGGSRPNGTSGGRGGKHRAVSRSPEGTRMKLLHKLFPLGHFLISLLFIGCGVALITFAALQLWRGVQPWYGLALNERLHTVLDSIAVLTVAVAALELSQTILEEEVQREAQMSLPTRVRRFLSRFMIVLVVSLSIEALVAVFQFNRTHPEHLPYAALIGLMAAALLAAWGLFIWLNRSAEELEPHAMAQVQREDEQVP